MKDPETKFLYFALAFASLLIYGCSDDWIWEPTPGPSHDLSGNITVVDSIDRPMTGDWSGIPVSLVSYGYPYTHIDSAITDKNGNWKIPNAPTGEYEIVVNQPGYSVLLQNVVLPVSDGLPAGGNIGTTMQHAVVIDSFFINVNGQDSSLGIYGHDPAGTQPPYGGWDIILCFDTVRNAPSSGQHLTIELADVYGARESGDAGAFSGELELNGSPTSSSIADTIYLVAYAINPIEAGEHSGPFPPMTGGYRTCGPPSNVIAIPRK
jgi:hypothetical protein